GPPARTRGPRQAPPRPIAAASPFLPARQTRAIDGPSRRSRRRTFLKSDAARGSAVGASVAPGALFARLGVVRQVGGGVDQADVREGLREVAGEPAGGRIVFLGQQAHVVADR